MTNVLIISKLLYVDKFLLQEIAFTGSPELSSLTLMRSQIVYFSNAQLCFMFVKTVLGCPQKQLWDL